MFDSFNNSFSTIPFLLMIAKVLISAIIIGIAAGISYGLLIFLLWYHSQVPHPYEIVVVYFTIALVLTMWYWAGVLFGKVWKHEADG